MPMPQQAIPSTYERGSAGVAGTGVADAGPRGGGPGEAQGATVAPDERDQPIEDGVGDGVSALERDERDLGPPALEMPPKPLGGVEAQQRIAAAVAHEHRTGCALHA
ncbi:MAG: hypothetical protein SangKO_068620 [Sandaracinaceae bacterium]